MSQDTFPERLVLLAPFGRHTRLILASYMRHALIIMLALLSVALTIDLVPQLSKVLGGRTGLEAAQRLGWFFLLRTADLLPRFFPLASFLGVLWTEVMHTISRERILVWNTGRSPVHCLIPLLFLAVLFGAAQFAFDAYLRPAAMQQQIDERLGIYGEEFERGLSKNAIWLSTGDDLVHAHINHAAPSALVDLTLYRLNATGRLAEVNNARRAVPGPQENSWELYEGSYWSIPPEAQGGAASVPLQTRGTEATATKFDLRGLEIALDPLWLTVYGIYPEYLSQPVLADLSSRASANDPRALFVTRLHVNYANALMPGAMALLSATLCLLLLAYSAPILWQLALLPLGYAGHLGMKTFILMGEHDYIPPVFAAWTIPTLLLALSGILLAFAQIKRRKAQSQMRKV